jgi:hypothetical protein
MEINFYILSDGNIPIKSKQAFFYLNILNLSSYETIFKELSKNNRLIFNVLNEKEKEDIKNQLTLQKIENYDIIINKGKEIKYIYKISPLLINSIIFALLIGLSWLFCFLFQICYRFDIFLLVGTIILSSFFYYIYQIYFEKDCKKLFYKNILKTL